MKKLDINMSIKDRRKLHIGDIYLNRAKCVHCNTTIISRHRHDYVTCNCGNLSVDGGSWYIRRSFDTDDYIECLIMFNQIPSNK